ncbi:unnamed protein product [Parascedosporium putredinis]|uniref:Uncharacterized protein n=1 Tax=Parascedosporium putredinis TaxID=1442378 RepID=A0A9P1H4I4_9PEZI|nr:unnamed protein product [Parascedosporium putredinis]CAI7996703.1 unnamed protein product [Parascedosporium putredinis]
MADPLSITTSFLALIDTASKLTRSLSLAPRVDGYRLQRSLEALSEILRLVSSHNEQFDEKLTSSILPGVGDAMSLAASLIVKLETKTARLGITVAESELERVRVTLDQYTSRIRDHYLL